MLNLVKLNLLNKKGKTFTENEVKTLKHFPSSIREWNNSLYVYNKNSLNLIPNTMIATIKIIKGYFSLHNYKIERKIRTKRLSRKFRKLSSNKIYINNGEFKHTNNKIIINLYLYNRQKHNYMLAINKLYIKTIKKIYKPNLNWNNKSTKLANIGNKKRINQYKLINRYNKYESKNVKSPTIKTYIHKLINFIYYRDNQIIKYIYSIYKLLCIKYLQKNNIYKYKLNCINTHKLKNIKLYKKNSFKNKYKSISIKLFNISLKNTKANEYKLFNLRLIRPKYWIILKINKNKLKINRHYNKIELGIINLLEKYILKKIILKHLINNTNISIKTTLEKKRIKSSKFNKSIVKKINIINRKGLLLLYFINREKYLVLKYFEDKNNKRMLYYISGFINKYYKKFLKKSWRKLKTYFFYRQLMYINKSKYNYNFLQYLSKYLYYLYNKNIEYNLINLKRFYLHSDILSESIKLKLNINKKKMLKQLNTIKKKIKTRKYKSVLHKDFIGKKLDLKKNLIKLKRKRIVKNLSYKNITGFRLEAKGRLTKRYTASRSIRKIRYKGNLLNIYSSYKGLSTILLRGNLKSNLQYTKLKSKSRIGSFGIKGWVSGT